MTSELSTDNEQEADMVRFPRSPGPEMIAAADLFFNTLVADARTNAANGNQQS